MTSPLYSKNIAFIILSVCLICEVFLSYTPIGPVPIRNYLIVLLSMLLLITSLYKGKLVLLKSFPAMYLSVFILIAIISDIRTVTDSKFIYAITRTLIMSLLIYSAVYSTLNTYYLNKILKLFVVIIGISSAVAIMQSLGVGVFWTIREMLSSSATDIISQGVALRSRPVGLSYNSIELGYQIASAFPFCYALQRGNSRKNYFFKVIMFIIVWGAIASETRSTLMAITAQYIFLKFKAYGSIRSKVIVGSTIILIASLVILLLTKFDYADRLVTMDLSSRGRYLLMYLGVLYAIRHPFGSGILFRGYNEFKKAYLGGVINFDTDIVAFAEQYTPHNQFINTAVMYGWIGIILLIVFYYKLFTGLNSVRAQSHSQMLSIATCFSALLIGYIVSSMFHNAGPFVGDPLAWYFIGMMAVLLKFHRQTVHGT